MGGTVKTVWKGLPAWPLMGALGTVILLNGLAWGLLLALRRLDAALLGIGTLAYFFGLRHAFDADHIAAIDNVTRKLRQDGQKPVGVGLFFSLGHSSIVIFLSLGLALVVRETERHMQIFERFGDVFGTTVSAAFLTLIGLINLYIFFRLWQVLRRCRQGDRAAAEHADVLELLEQRGFMARIFRVVYRRIDRSWQMYPVGFLFGLGFDTATEVAVLGISATMAQHGGLPLWGVMVFPLLFTAGMSLMDTVDGLVMIKIYDWAMIDAVRKLFFNTIITGLGVLVALVVGSTEWLQLLASEFRWQGIFWTFIQDLNFSTLGGMVASLMVLTWATAWLYYRRAIQPAE